MIYNHYKNYKNRKAKRLHFSYNFIDFKNNHGFGHIELDLNGKFDINEIREYIEEDKGYKNVVIISWQEKMR